MQQHTTLEEWKACLSIGTAFDPVLAPWHIRSEKTTSFSNGCAKEPAQCSKILDNLTYPWYHCLYIGIGIIEDSIICIAKS